MFIVTVLSVVVEVSFPFLCVFCPFLPDYLEVKTETFHSLQFFAYYRDQSSYRNSNLPSVTWARVLNLELARRKIINGRYQ